MDAAWEKVDRNKDGSISLREFERMQLPIMMKAVHKRQATRKEEEAKFEALSDAEKEADQKLEEKIRKRIRKTFSDMDIDDDGHLTKEEQQEYYRRSGADLSDPKVQRQMEQQWAMLDRDHDDAVSLAEFERLQLPIMKQQAQQRQASRNVSATTAASAEETAASAKAKSAAVASKQVRAGTKPNLSVAVPEDWEELDDGKGNKYWHNGTTGESVWHEPEAKRRGLMKLKMNAKMGGAKDLVRERSKVKFSDKQETDATADASAAAAAAAAAANAEKGAVAGAAKPDTNKPEDWEELDDGKGNKYWHNGTTGESVWHEPEAKRRGLMKLKMRMTVGAKAVPKLNFGQEIKTSVGRKSVSDLADLSRGFFKATMREDEEELARITAAAGADLDAVLTKANATGFTAPKLAIARKKKKSIRFFQGAGVLGRDEGTFAPLVAHAKDMEELREAGLIDSTAAVSTADASSSSTSGTAEGGPGDNDSSDSKRDTSSPAVTKKTTATSPKANWRKQFKAKEEAMIAVKKLKKKKISNAPWEALQNEKGGTYYWNNSTQRSQWERPTEWKDGEYEMVEVTVMLTKEAAEKLKNEEDVAGCAGADGAGSEAVAGTAATTTPISSVATTAPNNTAAVTAAAVAAPSSTSKDLADLSKGFFKATMREDEEELARITAAAGADLDAVLTKANATGFTAPKLAIARKKKKSIRFFQGAGVLGRDEGTFAPLVAHAKDMEELREAGLIDP
jgi:Ca2+-binding EF-hand superfamily protein